PSVAVGSAISGLPSPVPRARPEQRGSSASANPGEERLDLYVREFRQSQNGTSDDGPALERSQPIETEGISCPRSSPTPWTRAGRRGSEEPATPRSPVAARPSLKHH